MNNTKYRDEKDFRRALITFATVSDAIVQSNDFFLGIAPIFAVIARERNGEIFNQETFYNDAKSLFGLHIPPDVANFLIPRMVKAGLLERRAAKQNEVLFFWVEPKTSEKDRSDYESRIDEIISLFLEYCKSSESLFSKAFDERKLEEILFDFLISRDKSISAAQAALSEGDEKKNGSFSSEEDFVCARFLQKLEKNRPEIVSYLGEISNAAILSEVILELGEGRRNEQRPADVTFYIDSPLMMDFIGLSGPLQQNYAKSIIDGVRTLGGNAVIFDHSVEEIRDNLHGLLTARPGERRGPTADALRSNEVDEAYVAYAKNNIEDLVKECGIQIVNKPEATLTVQQKSRFSKDDDQYLYQKLHSHYDNDKALERDILSIKIVVAKRDGNTSTDLFRAKHVMITRNSLLRAVSKEFSEAQKQTPHQRIPPAEHIGRIAAILWLELGPTERIEISRKQLVAACSRVAAIRPEIIQKLQSTLQRIIPEKAAQFAKMMSNPHMMRVAMDTVAGSERFVTNESALSAFDRLKREMTVEADQRSKVERQKQTKRHKAEVMDLRTQLDLANVRVEEEKLRRQEAAIAIATGQINRYDEIGKWAARGFLTCGLLALGSAFIGFWPGIIDSGLRIASLIAAAVFTAGSFYGWTSGFIRAWFRKRGELACSRQLYQAGHLQADESLVVLYSDGTPAVSVATKSQTFQLAP